MFVLIQLNVALNAKTGFPNHLTSDSDVQTLMICCNQKVSTTFQFTRTFSGLWVAKQSDSVRLDLIVLYL